MILKDLLDTKRAVLFAGTQLGLERGGLSRYDQMRMLIKSLGLHNASSIYDSIFELASDLVLERAFEFLAATVPRPKITAALMEILKSPQTVQSPLDRVLAKLPFAHCVTTSIDDGIRQVFSHRDTLVVNHSSELIPDQALQTGRFLIFELFGNISEPTSVLLTNNDLQLVAFSSKTFVQVIGSALSERPMLFIGMSILEIESLFATLPMLARLAQFGPHVALVEEAFLENDVMLLKAKYNVITSSPAEFGKRSTLEVLQSVSTRNKKNLVTKTVVDTAVSCSRLTLQNVGPFVELDLDLNDAWNVILGDNGVGKTTILRALAVALVGVGGPLAGAAGRLLREGCSLGVIDVQIGNARYRTTLSRGVRGKTESSVTRLGPVAEGRVLALGFPALRGLAERVISGPTSGGSFTPAIGDLEPLMLGTIDRRLDDLRQWVVNLEIKQALKTAHARPGALERFMAFMKRLYGDHQLELDGIDQETHTVWVKTDDGRLRIEDLSQGTASLLCWVGTVIERMSEVFSNVQNPWEQPAIVLLDEIDVHLHPAWQREIVPIVNEFFPRVQIIATTHSPLIVQGLTGRDVFVAVRDLQTKTVTVEQTDAQPALMKTEDVLVSGLFGVRFNRPKEFAEMLDRLNALDSQETRTSSEDREREVILAAGEARLAPSTSDPRKAFLELSDLLLAVPIEKREVRLDAFLNASAISSQVKAASLRYRSAADEITSTLEATNDAVETSNPKKKTKKISQPKSVIAKAVLQKTSSSNNRK